MKLRVIGILLVLVIFGLVGVWHLGTFRQLGSEVQTFLRGGVAREATTPLGQKDGQGGNATSTPKVYLPVRWPASSTIDWNLRNQLPKELVAKIDQSPVPVLLPEDVAVARKVKVYPNEIWYQVAIDYPQEPTFSLMVQRLSFDPAQSPYYTDPVRGNPGRITVDGEKGTIAVFWIEYGTTYDLEMPCGDYGCEDKRSEASVLKFVNNLKYLGGKGWNGEKGGQRL